MRKFVLISIVGCMLLPACKKDPADVPIGTISATIDGTTTKFNISAKATTLPVQNGYGIEIHGYKKDPSLSGTDLRLIIARTSPITAGTYTENSAGNPLVEMSYFYDFFFGAGVGLSGFRSAGNPVKVIISEISASSIKGSFEGEIRGRGFSGDTVKSQVTNGVFYVSF